MMNRLLGETGRAVGKQLSTEPVLALPYLSVANAKDGYLDLDVVKTMQVTQDEIRRYSLRAGDVLFTEGGDADKLGRGCVWNGEIDNCLHQNHVFNEEFTSRYQACCLNYEFWLVELFGEAHSLLQRLALALQFTDITVEPQGEPVASAMPSAVANYIRDFDSGLTDEERTSPRYAYRMFFDRKFTNNRGLADRVVQFIDEGSEGADGLEKQYLVKKEVERTKYRPTDIVACMRNGGFPLFKTHNHTTLWKKMDAKNPGNGYGVQVVNTWYWYDRWVEVVRKHCQGNADRYR
jgi:hypothetical protein